MFGQRLPAGEERRPPGHGDELTQPQHCLTRLTVDRDDLYLVWCIAQQACQLIIVHPWGELDPGARGIGDTGQQSKQRWLVL